MLPFMSILDSLAKQELKKAIDSDSSQSVSQSVIQGCRNVINVLGPTMDEIDNIFQQLRGLISFQNE